MWGSWGKGVYDGQPVEDGGGYPRWFGSFEGHLNEWERSRLRRYVAGLIERGADAEWWTRAEANRLRFARWLAEQGIIGEWDCSEDGYE